MTRNMFSFYLIADTHYLDTSLCPTGEELERFRTREHIMAADSANIVHATFSRLLEDTETNTVLIAGDLTKNAERASHEGFLRELRRLTAAGKTVYTITAAHDYSRVRKTDTLPKYAHYSYKSNELVRLDTVAREELADMYAPYGIGQSIAYHEESMSYVAQLNEDIRLLALNCDNAPAKRAGHFSRDLMDWMREQIMQAQADNCMIIAMNHYPIIPSVQLFEIVRSSRMNRWKEIASFLADNNVPLVLTGHMHIQSINCHTTKNGNSLFDICTSALSSPPGCYRKLTIYGDDEHDYVDVQSIPVPTFDGSEAENASQIFDRHFDITLRKHIGRATGSIDKARLAYKPTHRKEARRKHSLLHMTARKVMSSRLQTIGRLLWIRTPHALRNVILKDYVYDIVHNMFYGDQPFGPDTAHYLFARRAIHSLRPLLALCDLFLKGRGIHIKLSEAILECLYNAYAWSDNNATLVLSNPFKTDNRL